MLNSWNVKAIQILVLILTNLQIIDLLVDLNFLKSNCGTILCQIWIDWLAYWISYQHVDSIFCDQLNTNAKQTLKFIYDNDVNIRSQATSDRLLWTCIIDVSEIYYPPNSPSFRLKKHALTTGSPFLQTFVEFSPTVSHCRAEINRKYFISTIYKKHSNNVNHHEVIE